MTIKFVFVVKSWRCFMKNRFYCFDVWSFYLLIAFPIIASVILLFLEEWLPALFCFILSLLFAIPCIIWRKLFFAKLEFSETKVSKVYGKEVINSIKWEDVVEVRTLPRNFIYILAQPYDKSILNNYKTNICFWITGEKLDAFLQFKEKFQDKITDLTILSKKTQELFH